MIVEPAAGTTCGQSESRQHYAGSTMIYIPTSLDQPVGATFGIQAGFSELSSSITQGGFAKSARPQRLRAPSPPLDGDLNPSSRPSGNAACRPSFSCRPGPLSVTCRLDPGGNAAQHAERSFAFSRQAHANKSPVEADLSASIASNPNALAATCRGLPPLNPPQWSVPCRKHLAAKHCEAEYRRGCRKTVWPRRR